MVIDDRVLTRGERFGDQLAAPSECHRSADPINKGPARFPRAHFGRFRKLGEDRGPRTPLVGFGTVRLPQGDVPAPPCRDRLPLASL
jgi:hypothetical protein